MVGIYFIASIIKGKSLSQACTTIEDYDEIPKLLLRFTTWPLISLIISLEPYDVQMLPRLVSCGIWVSTLFSCFSAVDDYDGTRSCYFASQPSLWCAFIVKLLGGELLERLLKNVLTHRDQARVLTYY